ncbi:MAG: InlB B-repeat-containing protein [Bacilli bacterium]|nr:InlB B-repeat-containing protein [Bacilli bacterium]
MKKIIVFLLISVMFIIPSANAANVAKIGTTEYAKLSAAITAASDEGQTTIVLISNVKECVTIPNTKDIILDLNQHTMINNGNNTIINNNGKLQITNGTITSTAGSGMINNNKNATLVINDGTYTATSSTSSKQVIYNNGGTLTISGTAELSTVSKIRATVHNLNYGVINITGGTIVSNSNYAVYNDRGTLNIGAKDEVYNKNFPIIKGGTYAVIANDPINVYDGSIKGKTYHIGKITDTTNLTIENDLDETKIADIEEFSSKDEITTDTDGFKTLKYTIDDSNLARITYDAQGGSVEPDHKRIIKGTTIGGLPKPKKIDNLFNGWYDDPNNGNQISESTTFNGDATIYAHWTYVDPNTVAYVEGKGYMSLAQAFAEGGNIKLMSDVIITKNLFMSANATFDLNGHTIMMEDNKIIVKENVSIIDSSNNQNGLITSNDDFTIYVGINNTPTNGQLTVKGGTIEGLGKHGAIWNFETLEIDGGKIQGLGNKDGYTIINNKTMTMKSGIVFSDNDYAVNINDNGTFVMDGGTIETTGRKTQALNLHGNCSATINDGTILALSEKGAAIASFGNTVLEINSGLIKGYDMAVAGNGNEESGNVTITVNGGDLIATNGIGMYLPQINSLTTINGGNISGFTAIEIRASKLIINGGNITGTASTYSVNENSSGTTTKGAAIAVSQHNTRLPLEVYINDGNFKGAVPILDVNPQNNPADALAKVKIYIKKGDFVSTSDETIIIDDAIPQEPFITGGTYTHNPVIHVEDGYGVVVLPDDRFEVTKIHNITSEDETTEIITVERDNAPYKQLVQVMVNRELKEGEVIEIKDEEGNIIEVVDNTFVMPDSDVTISIVFKETGEVKGEEENPRTDDTLSSYMVLLIMSFLGLLGARIYNDKIKGI